MTKWNGGKCPVDGETIVRVTVNVWKEPIEGAAKWWCGGEKSHNWWQKHPESLARIIAYEVVA